MTGEQIAGVVRHLLTVAGGALVTGGVLDEQTLLLAAGAIATLAGVAWSIFAKRKFPGLK